MSRIRLWCLWLVMLALPLQGFAAVSMLHCGAGAVKAASASVAHQDGHHGGHDHAAHQADASADGSGAPTADDYTAAGHECPLCAFCGHSVALNEFPKPMQFGEPAHASPQEPWILIQTLAVLVPDKPPRA